MQDPFGRPFDEIERLARLRVMIEDALANRNRMADRLAAKPGRILKPFSILSMTEPAPLQQGLFLSLEGTEGCGKSTQMRILIERLRTEGYTVVENQEPGATPIGKQIRRILLDPANREMTPMTELLLMFASRAQAAAEIVRPALTSGAIVASDRYTDSTLAYQGAARGIGFSTVWEAHRLAVGSLLPNLTLCLTIDVEQGLDRARRRNLRTGGEAESRIDEQTLDFHRRVLAGYLRIANEDPVRFRLVDGRGSILAVSEAIWRHVQELLALHPHILKQNAHS